MTYSLVAFDPETGEHGVAAESNWFSVGSFVTFAEPGVGAVATQGKPRPDHGPRGLALMRDGRGSAEALAERIAADPGEGRRQVAMIDARGQPAVYTGADCPPFSGSTIGVHHAAQANLARTGAVWEAISAAYRESSGPLAVRLLDALDAGETAGGDLRGRQSAALLVVPPGGEAWERVVEVRVEDHPEPLRELRRLVAMKVAYEVVEAADDLILGGDVDGAADLYVEAWERSPEAIELSYWAGFSLVHRGEEERGKALLREAIAANDGWARLLDLVTAEGTPGFDRARVLLGT